MEVEAEAEDGYRDHRCSRHRSGMFSGAEDKTRHGVVEAEAEVEGLSVLPAVHGAIPKHTAP